MAFAAHGHGTELRCVRDMAVKLMALKGEITIDDLRAVMPEIVWGNWAGSVFNDRRFICAGFAQATHEESHARLIRKWSLRK